MTALIAQARLDSRRLPRKALLPLSGEPLLLRVLQALASVPADRHVLATPADCERDFAPLAERAGFTLHIGPKDDVLARYCGAARAAGLGPGDFVIRATGDNPFVFADAAGAIAREAALLGADYAAWAALPYGAGVEAVKAAALFRAEAEAKAAPEREHVCPYLYGHGELFALHRPLAPALWRRPGLRLTVDEAADYERACRLYAALDAAFGAAPERYTGAAIIAAAGDTGAAPVAV